MLAQVCETCGRAAGMGWPVAILVSAVVIMVGIVAAALLVFGVVGTVIEKMVKND